MIDTELYNAYSQISNPDYLSSVLEEKKAKLLTVYVVMNQIHSNPEHVKIEGVFLSEEKAHMIAQSLEFAWVDEETLHM